jgi:hypothetical protein
MPTLFALAASSKLIQDMTGTAISGVMQTNYRLA